MSRKLKAEEKEFLEKIAAYLPYDLKMWDVDDKHQLSVVFGYSTASKEELLVETILEDNEYYKPILKPISDLPYTFCKDYDLQREKVKSYIKSGRLTLKQYNYLIKNHYDVHDLIGQGKAVNINDLK